MVGSLIPKVCSNAKMHDFIRKQAWLHRRGTVCQTQEANPLPPSTGAELVQFLFQNRAQHESDDGLAPANGLKTDRTAVLQSGSLRPQV